MSRPCSFNKWCRATDGKEINLFDPDPALFTVERIADALARINRFAGHWVRPVSVARHSVFVAELLRAANHNIEIQLQGLFHDAAEAFTTDIPTPIKRLLHVRNPSEPYRGGDSLVPYVQFDDILSHRIFLELEIEWPLRREVHEMDRWVTGQERDWVAGKSDLYRGATTDPGTVARIFKLRAEELFRERARDILHDADCKLGARE